MKTAIIYYSKHHGNTKKLLDAIKATNEIVLMQERKQEREASVDNAIDSKTEDRSDKKTIEKSEQKSEIKADKGQKSLMDRISSKKEEVAKKEASREPVAQKSKKMAICEN